MTALLFVTVQKIAEDKEEVERLEKQKNEKTNQNIADLADIDEEIDLLKKEIATLESTRHFSLGEVVFCN